MAIVASEPTFSAPPLCCCFCCLPSPSASASIRNDLAVFRSNPVRSFQLRSSVSLRSSRNGYPNGIMALIVDPSDSAQGSIHEFIARMEKAWLISKQPRPVSCTSCKAEGHIECAWCKGTGFFILGDNVLCEVPSRNTSCLICLGRGSVQCKDCKGTGYRARWLDNPSSKIKGS